MDLQEKIAVWSPNITTISVSVHENKKFLHPFWGCWLHRPAPIGDLAKKWGMQYSNLILRGSTAETRQLWQVSKHIVSHSARSHVHSVKCIISHGKTYLWIQEVSIWLAQTPVGMALPIQPSHPHKDQVQAKGRHSCSAQGNTVP